jgi:hypothetical protein
VTGAKGRSLGSGVGAAVADPALLRGVGAALGAGAQPAVARRATASTADRRRGGFMRAERLLQGQAAARMKRPVGPSTA